MWEIVVWELGRNSTLSTHFSHKGRGGMEEGVGGRTKERRDKIRKEVKRREEGREARQAVYTDIQKQI